MVYFGENNDYILAECEICKSEMYLEKRSITDETSYEYKLVTPVKCLCGSIDECVSKSKKSCYSIRQELLGLSDLLHKRQDISDKMNEINAEMNKKIKRPSFLQIFIEDILFSLKIFFITIAATIGVEIFLFIISSLMFFSGLAFQKTDLSKAGNELFYNLNIFKDRGGAILSKIGFPEQIPPLSELAETQLVTDYIPYALAGVFSIIFYISLAILAVRLGISITHTVLYASKIMGHKYNVNQKKEEYGVQLNAIAQKYQDLTDLINAQTIVTNDYKNIRAIDTILRYFLNNRVDTLREAINLFHEEDLKNKQIEFQKAIFTELRQTKRYAKALYILTSDENAKVEVKEEIYETEEPNVGEILKNAFSKIKSAPKKIKASPETKALESKSSVPENAPPVSNPATQSDEKENPVDL